MTFEGIAKIVAQGSFNYYSKQIEIICQTSADTICNISLYIDKSLVELVTIGHTDPNVYLQMIKDTVEILKDKALSEV